MYDLVKQQLVKKMQTNCQWVSDVDIHPAGRTVTILPTLSCVQYICHIARLYFMFVMGYWRFQFDFLVWYSCPPGLVFTPRLLRCVVEV